MTNLGACGRPSDPKSAKDDEKIAKARDDEDDWMIRENDREQQARERERGTRELWKHRYLWIFLSLSFVPLSLSYILPTTDIPPSREPVSLSLSLTLSHPRSLCLSSLDRSKYF